VRGRGLGHGADAGAGEGGAHALRDRALAEARDARRLGIDSAVAERHERRLARRRDRRVVRERRLQHLAPLRVEDLAEPALEERPQGLQELVDRRAARAVGELLRPHEAVVRAARHAEQRERERRRLGERERVVERALVGDGEAPPRGRPLRGVEHGEAEHPPGGRDGEGELPYAAVRAADARGSTTDDDRPQRIAELKGTCDVSSFRCRWR
jgi:hypothetical protein